MQEELHPVPDYGITAEEVVVELERRKAAGAFAGLQSLEGNYANADVQISTEELNAYLHEIRTEWEAEMDELK